MDKDKRTKNIQSSKELINMPNNADYVDFVSKKAQKIATALYLVTNLFSSNEPLRQNLRDRSLRLLSDVNQTRQDLVTDPDEESRLPIKVSHIIIDIISLLDVAKGAGLLSEMNHVILSKELNVILSYTDGGFTGEDKVVFSDNFFVVGSIRQKNRSYTDAGGYKGHSKGHLDKDMSFIQNGQKDILDTKKTEIVSRRKSLRKERVKSGRRDTILGLIKDKGPVTIKDISDVIRDCSEKTIQRDLGLLIVGGIVRKEGDRRWSKYYAI